MDNLIITSADGHAVVPPELWPDYLEKKYHKYLRRLHEDRELFSGNMALLGGKRVPDAERHIFDSDKRFDPGQWGLWDRDVRLAEMDREGIAAELAIPGDFRAIDMFWNTTNATYVVGAVDAGARGYNRWCADTFGRDAERILMIGAPLSGSDIDGVVAEAHWLADHKFTGVYTPGYCAMPNEVPIFEKHWDPVFAAYAETGLTLITHAGYGMPQGFMHSEVEAAAAEVRAEGGDSAALVDRLMTGVFNAEGVFADLRSRQGLWLFMLSGLFDRYPTLRMMLTEVRADWIPSTLAMIDRVWEQNRDRLPAKRRPSEYWGENVIAGLSFMKKSEIEMRHEIGVEAMAFGRDYPHTEATWPNTNAYFSDIFAGVPEAEARAILGENMVRFLRLDRPKLAAVAERIAPTFAALTAGGALSPELKRHLDIRCGYSEPSEGDRRLAQLEPMLQRDVSRLAAAASVYA